MNPLSSCFARWDAGVLTIGNALFTESWQSENDGRLRLLSFQRKGATGAGGGGGGKWIAPAKVSEKTDTPDAPNAATSSWRAQFTSAPGRVCACETEALLAALRLENSDANAWRSYQFQIFPNVAGAVMQVSSSEAQTKAEEASSVAEPKADGIEADGVASHKGAGTEAGNLTPVTLRSSHVLVRDVQFMDQTDHYSNFTAVREWMMHPSERPLALKTNLVLVEDPATDMGAGAEGFCWVLLAPLRHVRDAWSAAADFSFAFHNGALTASSFPGGYALARVAYTGGQAGATAALHEFQRALHEWIPGRDGILLSNTWGDRGRGDRISEAFMLEEIAAARTLGVEVVQLDDGWEKGATSNTAAQRNQGVWNGFWAADPEFWKPHPVRFPRGLEPVIQAAREAGVRIGLWYAPDSSNNMKNWERDAAQILYLWRTHGVEHFKLDAMKLHSRESEERMNAFCERVQQESGGRILFDFDATAEHRTTYWGRVPGGTLFLENRYTDWGNYHPHQTLRAVWSLSSWVLPSRLRLEFLNPSRNVERYGDDPLRPSAYPAEYLFAVTMVASPLAWFENSKIPADVVRAWAPLIAVWKEHREAFHHGQVLPVGAAPNGFSWTGFVSWCDGSALSQGDGGDWLYALVFRELAPAGEARIALPATLPAWETVAAPETLAGQGSAELAGADQDEARCGRRTLVVRIADKQRFVLVRWRVAL
ncbi:hypothetical protein Ga0100231_019670 [Opitutaceae bacterium TAV4]|nr:hypothetical protein Ga0100231_019670 [Opitutaceae bacterium TAV4]